MNSPTSYKSLVWVSYPMARNSAIYGRSPGANCSWTTSPPISALIYGTRKTGQRTQPLSVRFACKPLKSERRIGATRFGSNRLFKVTSTDELLERFELDNCRSKVIAYPERGRVGGVIHVHPANVGHPWEEILGHLIGFGIHSHDVIVRHSARPGISVLVQNRIVGIRPFSGDRPLLESLGFRIEHPDLVPTKFCKPETVLGIHVTSPRAGVGGRSREGSGFHGPGIDLCDELTVEVHAIEVVLRVRGNAIGAKVTIRERRILRDIAFIVDGLPLSSLQVHLILVVGTDPYLAVHVNVPGRYHRGARGIPLRELRGFPCLEFLRLRVEPRDDALVHRAQPQVAIAIRRSEEHTSELQS